jgi:hypothetical protein
VTLARDLSCHIRLESSMSAHWKDRHTRWWPHHVGGVPRSLTHLHPFSFSHTLPLTDKYPAVTVEVRVAFSCHVFTRDQTADDGGMKPYIVRERETRMFCEKRYNLSKGLKALVESLATRPCFFTGQQNYFTVDMPSALSATEEYRVFFDVRPSGQNAVLVFVQSAYAANLDDPAPRGVTRKKVGFNVLVNLALRGKRPSPAA